MKLLKLSMISIMMLGFAVPAFATELYLLGAGDYTKAKNETQAYKEKLGLGGGALLDFNLSRRLSFQLGGVYANRTVDGTPEKVIFPYLHAPVSLRLWLGRYVVLTGGGYYAYGVGNEANFTANGLKKADYGVHGGLGFNLPLGRTVSFVLEGRYNYGLADVSQDGRKTKWQGYQGLAGLSFWLGR